MFTIGIMNTPPAYTVGNVTENNTDMNVERAHSSTNETAPPNYTIGGYTVPPGYTRYVKLVKSHSLENISSFEWIIFLFNIATVVLSAIYYHSSCKENLQLFMILGSGGGILSVINRLRFKGMEKVQDNNGKTYYVNGDKAGDIDKLQYIIILYSFVVSIWLIKIFFDTPDDQCEEIIYKFALAHVIITMAAFCFLALVLALFIIVGCIKCCK